MHFGPDGGQSTLSPPSCFCGQKIVVQLLVCYNIHLPNRAIEYLPSHITFDNLFKGVDSIAVSICLDKYSIRIQDPDTSSDNEPRCLVLKSVFRTAQR